MSRNPSRARKTAGSKSVRQGAAGSGLRAQVLELTASLKRFDHGLAWKFPGEAVVVLRSRGGSVGALLRAVIDGKLLGAAAGAAGIRVVPVHAARDEWRMVLCLGGLRDKARPAGLARLRASLRRVAQAHAGSIQLERTRKAWSCALNSLEEGLLLVRADGVILEAGDSCGPMFGVRPSDLKGRQLAEALALDTVLTWPPRSRINSLEVGARHSSGGALAVVLTSHPLGRTGAHLVVLSDRTAERRAGEQARRRDRLAVLGELSAGVAHEIRNPLAGINTSAQVLRRRLGPEDERIRFVDVIQDEVARLDRIVSGLLDYARPWNSTLRRVSIPECVGKVVGLVRETAESQGVELQARCAADLPEIFADPDQLTQVLLNIFRNALEAMLAGGRLTFEAELIQRVPFVRRTGGRRAGDPVLPQEGPVLPQPAVQMRVADTGDGIHPEHLPRLFDPFFTTKPTGTGLGLAICQTLIHEHGGSIAAVSHKGQGTLITIELPVEKRHGQRRRDGNGAAPAHR